MKKDEHAKLGDRTRWAMGAAGIVLAYFGAFALLMYPVIGATTGTAA